MCKGCQWSVVLERSKAKGPSIVVPKVSEDKMCQGCQGKKVPGVPGFRRSTRGQGFLKNSFQIKLDS